MQRILLLCLVLLAAEQPATAQPAKKKPPVAKIVVVHPQSDQQLDGLVDVRIKIEVPQGATEPKAFYAGLGGAPWTELKQAGDEWAAEIDSALSPNGAQTLTVITDNKGVKKTINVTVENPLKVYFADLHSHTGYSDGTLTPAIAHDYARNVAKLDVFCLTDHLEKVDDEEWLDTREVAWDANVDGEFVVIPGLEWTTGWGHINIFDPNTRHWPKDATEFYKACADSGVVTKFNHPGDGTKSHSGLEFSEIGDKTVQLMEVRQVTEEKALIRALDKGWHLAPEGSDDTHSPNWGNVRSWTGILAPGLSKRNILDALANRRVYSTLDRNCVLQFGGGSAESLSSMVLFFMGDVVEEPQKEVVLVTAVEDPDEGDTIAKIELYEDGVVVETDEPNSQKREWDVTLKPKPGKHYYFVKVTQADGNLLWSAPIWLTVAEE